jgi:hypothetical protein
VEHACYRCHTVVEEGVAFCPHCNAPLIRVSLPEILPPVAGDMRPDVAVSYQGYPSISKIQWSRAMPVVTLAGLIGAILMMLPGGILGPIVAGAMSVAFYRRRTMGIPVTASMGWRLGAASGFVASCILVVLFTVQVAVFHTGGQLRETMLKAVRQAAERNSDPQAQQVVEYLKTPAGIAVTLVFGLFVVLILCVILSSIGGAIGAAWFGRKRTG